jgi:preprotein translocase subunit SecE
MRGRIRVAVVWTNPLKFLRDVRNEAAKVTWPSRKETLITTGLVFALSALAAIFFFLADQVVGLAIRAIFGFRF